MTFASLRRVTARVVIKMRESPIYPLAVAMLTRLSMYHRAAFWNCGSSGQVANG